MGHVLCLGFVAAVRSRLVRHARPFLQDERISESSRLATIQGYTTGAARIFPASSALSASKLLAEFATELAHQFAITNVTFRVVVALS